MTYSAETVMLKDGNAVTIRSVEPDSLVYLYALQHRVLLPVEYDGNTESQDQFFMERIEFQPDSVMAQVLINDTVRHRYR